MVIEVPGYRSEGHDTLGAEYARSHPEDMPEGFTAGVVGVVAGRKQLRFTTGEPYKFYGMQLRLLAVNEASLCLDLRSYPPEQVARYLDAEMLVFWRGFYWYVPQVRGAFVVLQFWGTTIRREGYRTWTRKGKMFTRPIVTKVVPVAAQLETAGLLVPKGSGLVKP